MIYLYHRGFGFWVPACAEKMQVATHEVPCRLWHHMRADGFANVRITQIADMFPYVAAYHHWMGQGGPGPRGIAAVMEVGLDCGRFVLL